MRPTIMSWILSVGAIVCGPGRALTQAEAVVTAFVDVSVIPMDRERVLPDQTVIVRGDRIVAMGPAARVPVPAGATRVEGRAKYLLPGLADMHVHLAQIGTKDGNILDTAMVGDMLFSFVANGVTTVRDMHAGPSRSGDHWILSLRQRVARGELLGPRIYAAGDIYGSSSANPADVARRVEALKAAGYDYVKVTPADSIVYDSTVAAAHRVHLPIVGHGFLGLIDSPNYTIARVFADHWLSAEHLFGYFWYATGTKIFDSKAEAALPRVADSTIRRIASETKRAGVWNCPTLVIKESGVEDSHMSGDADPIFDLRLIKALNDVGAGLLLGTDAYARLGNNDPEFARSGFAIHRELELLVGAGLTPFQALATGTTSVARFLHTEDSTGTIAVGKRADLILLTANPLVNIRHTTALAGVMLGGRWLPRSALDAHIDSLPADSTASGMKWGTPAAQMRMLRTIVWH